MSETKVLIFGEDSIKMTTVEGLAFVERTRRQLDRFRLLPRASGQAITPDDEMDIRRQCDELEADILRSTNTA